MPASMLGFLVVHDSVLDIVLEIHSAVNTLLYPVVIWLKRLSAIETEIIIIYLNFISFAYTSGWPLGEDCVFNRI